MNKLAAFDKYYIFHYLLSSFGCFINYSSYFDLLFLVEEIPAILATINLFSAVVIFIAK